MSHAQSAPPILVESHAAAVPNETDSALERACEIIVDAGLAGARWAIFPEGFIPGYPAWVWRLRSGEALLLDALRADAAAGAVRIPSDITDRLCRVAQRAEVNVAVGVIERDDATGETFYYSTLVYIDTRGQIVGTYRAPLLGATTRPVWIPGQRQETGEEGRTAAIVGGI